MKCDCCNGSGLIVFSSPMMIDGNGYIAKCIQCNGTGEIRDYSRQIHIQNLETNINRLEEFDEPI